MAQFKSIETMQDLHQIIGCHIDMVEEVRYPNGQTALVMIVSNLSLDSPYQVVMTPTAGIIMHGYRIDVDPTLQIRGHHLPLEGGPNNA